MKHSFLLALLMLCFSASAEFEVSPPYECSPVGETPRRINVPLCLIDGWRSGIDSYCQPIAFTEISRARANALFRELAEDPAIPYRYLPDGCQARAQKMAEILLSNGIQPGKIFVKGKFEVPNPWDSYWPIVRWQFHVAIVIGTEEGKMVIDPSLFSEPVTLEYFLTTFKKFPVSRIDEVYLTGPFTYELNHRALLLDGFRASDLKCGADLLKAGLIMQGKKAK